MYDAVSGSQAVCALLNRLPAGKWQPNRHWLASLSWPEQIDRAERPGQALDLVAADPPRLGTGDMLVDLPWPVADSPPGVPMVVFHSAVAACLDHNQRSRFSDVTHTFKATLGAHWVSNEAPGVIHGAESTRGIKAGSSSPTTRCQSP